ncbi:MAG: Verru_Chthon cassette protein B [Chthoniobacteraceae bacterium]
MAQPIAMQYSVRRQLSVFRSAGFSLVEISLALAVIAVALVALLGLMPSGMSNFRAALDSQIAGEIFQRVVADAQEADFDTLIGSAVEKGGAGSQFYRLPLRHFDNQGTEVKVINADAPTATESKDIMYTVRVRGSMPGDPDPSRHTANFATSLPGAFNPRGLTFITVQVAVTGGTRQLAPLVDADSFLIGPAQAAQSSMSVRTYAALVARSGYAQ